MAKANGDEDLGAHGTPTTSGVATEELQDPPVAIASSATSIGANMSPMTVLVAGVIAAIASAAAVLV